jgi:hypothetical protein
MSIDELRNAAEKAARETLPRYEPLPSAPCRSCRGSGVFVLASGAHVDCQKCGATGIGVAHGYGKEANRRAAEFEVTVLRHMWKATKAELSRACPGSRSHRELTRLLNMLEAHGKGHAERLAYYSKPTRRA